MKPLRQDRARATLDRLLAAATALLAERPFEDISVADIAAGAGVTTGAIYARFPDKDAILVALHDRLAAEIALLLATVMDPVRWAERPIEDSLHEMFAHTIALYREHAPLIRALTARARSNAGLRARMEQGNVARIAAVTRCVLATPAGAAHPRAERGVHFALLMTTGALREAILFHEFWPGGFDASDAWLARELSRGFLAYLTATPRRTRGAAPPKRRRSPIP